MISERRASVKKESRIKKYTSAALAGVVAASLFVPFVWADGDAATQMAAAVGMETAEYAAGDDAAEASYEVKLAAWADDNSCVLEDAAANEYSAGKEFYVDVVVTGSSYSGFQAQVVYDSDRLRFDAGKTNTFVSEKNKEETNGYVTVDPSEDGKITDTVTIVRTGDATKPGDSVVTRLYFKAVKDKKTEIKISNVKIGDNVTDGSAAALPDERITSCIVNVTKSYLSLEPVIGSGTLNANGDDDYDIVIGGTFAVDVISMGRDIDCAELTVKYDTSKLEFDTDKADEAMKADQGLQIGEPTADGQITITRTSDGIVAGRAVTTLWFKTIELGTARIDISAAKAGTVDAKTTYDAEDLAGCKVTVIPEGEKVTLVDHTNGTFKYGNIKIGADNIFKDKFTFTVNSISTPVAAFTTDRGKTYTKLTATKVADAENTYSFTATAAKGMQIYVAMLGDVDLDAEVSVMDVNVIRNYLLDRSELSALASIIADIDFDGEVSVMDVNMIRNYLLDRVEKL